MTRRVQLLIAGLLLCGPLLFAQTAEHRWAVDSTGALLYGGVAPYDVVPGLSSTERRIVLATRPDPRTQKWDGSAIVAKTATEIANYDVTLRDAALTEAVTRDIDRERIFSAIVWAVIDTYSAPATKAKYDAARTKILAAYKNRPWVP